MQFKRIMLFCVVAFALGVEAAAQTPLPGESNVSRPGGVYASLRTAGAAACAAQCAADSLCLAWTYQPNGACELTAIAATPINTPGARSGLSSRAPDFARRISYVRSSAAPAAPHVAQAPVDVFAPAAPPPEPTPFADDAGDDLLGGPADDAQTELRPRLGSAGR